ncbi:MAG TPA: germination protein YpeB [Bacillales bacterium]|nr:germination protein YpeB [Bacillales bacterium]
MARNITIIVLAIALVAAGYWGYQERQHRRAVSIQAENHYQQVFHNLVYHVGELRDRIGTTLAMSSSQTLSPTLAQVWRLSSVAHNEVGQLPLTLMPFHNTQVFLSKIGDFSYRVSTRNLTKRPLSKDEYNTLQALYKQSSAIETELRQVQAVSAKKNLRWMDVKMQLASGNNGSTGNAYVDGFKTINKKVQGYEGIHWGPENAEMAKDRHVQLSQLKGNPVSKAEAADIARSFLGYGANVDVNVQSTGKGALHALYSVSLRNPKTGAPVYMDVTKKGGYPVWMIQDGQYGKPKISLNQAQKVAAKFLKQHDISNMMATQSDQYGDMGAFTFVKKQDNVLIYPESIRMKVSLDSGKVAGYDATDYIVSSKPRTINKPKITKQQALKALNENVDVKIVRLAVITNDIGKEVLCYEVVGTIGHDTYRIFVNADSGVEEMVKKLHNPSPIYQPA